MSIFFGLKSGAFQTTLQDLDDPVIHEAYHLAAEVMMDAYAPYSKYKVGAVVIGAGGKLYPGVNIENSSFGATLCAERAAIYNWYTNSIPIVHPFSMLVWTSSWTSHWNKSESSKKEEGVCSPCGLCLQVISEFIDPNGHIMNVNFYDQTILYGTIDNFMPHKVDTSFHSRLERK